MENESVDGIYERTAPEKPIYNVSNYIFYNYGSGPGGVLVQNDKKQNTTIASGYYLITGLPNGVYDLGISKAGFNTGYTGYLDVTINRANKPIINTTCDIMSSAKVRAVHQ
ncbi:MAG: hypothetical protein OIN66_17580 [Candidatus Methanoperedens sp.]|nr:hypothetical protein [Candidatus Methanoperedens sp.]